MGEARDVEVMSLGYRLAHTLNLILFTLLAITGGMLLSIEAFSWLAYSIGVPLSALAGDSEPISAGVQWARTWHRFLGHVWGALLIAYGIYVLMTRRITIFDGIRKPFKDQLAEAKALFNYYFRGREVPREVAEKLGRHNVFVSYLFILLLVAVVLISVSGLVLVYGPGLGVSLETLRLMLLLHDIGFALAMLFTLLHLFAVLIPHNRPLLVAVFTNGRVSLEWARAHMPAFIRRLLGAG